MEGLELMGTMLAGERAGDQAAFSIAWSLNGRKAMKNAVTLLSN